MPSTIPAAREGQTLQGFWADLCKRQGWSADDHPFGIDPYSKLTIKELGVINRRSYHWAYRRFLSGYWEIPGRIDIVLPQQRLVLGMGVIYRYLQDLEAAK